MINLILGFLWHSALAQFGIAGLTLAGAIATYIYIPSTGIRHLAVSVAAVCCVFLFLGPKLYLEGVNHERAQTVAAEARARKLGDTARADALHDVTSGVRDPFDSDDAN